MNTSLRVLFSARSFTDIRCVTGLSQICQLTLAIPARTHQASGLKMRVGQSGAAIPMRHLACEVCATALR